jgi:outer membrane protein TolC
MMSLFQPKQFFVFFACLCLPALVFAEGEKLSLEEARSLALANSRSLAKYNMNVRSSVLDEKTQTYAGLPSLSLGASASAEFWASEGNPTPPLEDSFRAGASFSVSQNLWDGGKNALLRQINALSTESARQDALAEYYAVLNAADTAYYGVLEGAANLAAAENALETAALSLSMAELRYENRMISEAEYLQALAEKESKETARNQARQTLSLNRLKLRNLTGLSEPRDLEEVGFEKHETLIQILAGLDDNGTLRFYDLLWKQTEVKNPAMVKAAINTGKAEKNLSLAARDYSPTLSASFSTGLNYTLENGLKYSSGSFSLSGRIPLDFWVTAANVEKRQIAREQAALDYLSAGEALDLELQTAVLDLIFRAGQVLSSRRALDYARKHYEYVLELFRLSRNSLSELYDAGAAVLSNQNQLNQAQYGFFLGLSKIRGLGLFESEEEIASIIKKAALEPGAAGPDAGETP